MTCSNCGAELNNGRCEYCGSFFPEYQEYVRVRPDKDDDSHMQKVNILCNASIDPNLMIKAVREHVKRGERIHFVRRTEEPKGNERSD